MSFQTLLAELDAFDLAKSAPADGGAADDAEIAAAAEEGEAAGEGEGEEAGDAGDAGEGDASEGEEEGFGKSFKFETEDGQEVEGIDATDLLKSLIGRVGALEGQLAEESDLQKALGGLFGMVKSQNDLIKSLQSQVATLSNAGRGRKTVVHLTDKPAAEPLNKSQPADGLKPDEFMAKALAAQEAGKITGRDVAVAEGYLARGQAIPANIVNRVLA